MRLQVFKLQAEDKKARNIRSQSLKNSQEEIEEVLNWKIFSYLPEIIRTKIINRHHNDPLESYFGINKTRELIVCKQFFSSFQSNIEAYIKGCDVYLAFKTVRHRPYEDLHQFLISTNCWKDLSIDCVIGLLFSTN